MTKYYKILKHDLTHNGFVYTEGLNQLKEPFSPSPEECSSGGLYFTDQEHVGKWLDMYYGTSSKIADVELCSDSRVVHYSTKSKTDKFILSNIRPITEWMKELNEDRRFDLIKQDGKTLRYVPEDKKTFEVCLAAVTKDGMALEYVPEDKKTSELCLAAVKQKGVALEYVPEDKKTYELCLTAVTKTGWAMKFVPEEMNTSELCLAAVKQKGVALQYVPEDKKTYELCLTAVNNDGWAMIFVPDELKTPELSLIASKRYEQDELKLYIQNAGKV